MKSAKLTFAFAISFVAAVESASIAASFVSVGSGTAQEIADDSTRRTARVQGEYEGWISGGVQRTRLGVQLVARGREQYRATVLPGGLPRHAESAEPEEMTERVDTRTIGGIVKFQAAGHRFLVNANEARVYSSGGILRGVLRKVHRTSNTLGASPPAGAIRLFDGTDTGELTDPVITEDGLLSEGPMTRRDVRDFFIHAEFRIPLMEDANAQARGNSGLYLQRRYEVQILDSFGLAGANNECGSLYQQRRPDVNACFPPLAWQTFDIDFRAARYNDAGEKTENARISVKQNGIVLHDDVELTNKTGAGRPEGPQPLPIWFQDHGDPVRFRNVWMIER